MGDGTFDLVVVGTGPAGYVGAIRAAQLGMKTAVVEKDRIGGVCLNIGCIPSKTLIHNASAYLSLASMEEAGVGVDRSRFDYAVIHRRSRKAAETLSKGIESSFRKWSVRVFKGKGVLRGPGEILIDGGESLRCRNILLAPGSEPRSVPGFAIDEKDILSSTGALMMEKLPSSILIIGAGAIGMEFAYIFNAFGVKTIVAEFMDRILPLEDAESAEILRRAFAKKDVEIMTSAQALSFERTDGKLRVILNHEALEKTVEVEKVLVAVGRNPLTEGLGLEKAGIVREKGFIPVADYGLTALPGVYAAGDCVRSPQLAHVASKEAIIAVEHMAGRASESRIDPAVIPSVIYTEPQIAGFGPTEEALKKQGRSYARSVYPYTGSGKSIATGEMTGFLKILYDPGTGEILAGHMIGKDAAELIHEVLLAKKAELLPDDVARMIHAHPTFSEVVMEAMRQIDGWNIHL